jgi:hypothetical protein
MVWSRLFLLIFEDFREKEECQNQGQKRTKHVQILQCGGGGGRGGNQVESNLFKKNQNSFFKKKSQKKREIF